MGAAIRKAERCTGCGSLWRQTLASGLCRGCSRGPAGRQIVRRREIDLLDVEPLRRVPRPAGPVGQRTIVFRPRVGDAVVEYFDVMFNGA